MLGSRTQTCKVPDSSSVQLGIMSYALKPNCLFQNFSDFENCEMPQIRVYYFILHIIIVGQNRFCYHTS